jgi:hypothetical protein
MKNGREEKGRQICRVLPATISAVVRPAPKMEALLAEHAVAAQLIRQPRLLGVSGVIRLEGRVRKLMQPIARVSLCDKRARDTRTRRAMSERMRRGGATGGREGAVYLEVLRWHIPPALCESVPRRRSAAKIQCPTLSGERGRRPNPLDDAESPCCSSFATPAQQQADGNPRERGAAPVGHTTLKMSAAAPGQTTADAVAGQAGQWLQARPPPLARTAHAAAEEEQVPYSLCACASNCTCGLTRARPCPPPPPLAFFSLREFLARRV